LPDSERERQFDLMGLFPFECLVPEAREEGGWFQPHPTTTKSELSFLAFVSRGKRPQIHEKVVSKARRGREVPTPPKYY
jgi:hypothetical protein